MQKRDKPTSGSELDSKPAVALKKQQTEDTAHPGTSHDLSDADSSDNNPDVLVVREEGKLDEDEDKLDTDHVSNTEGDSDAHDSGLIQQIEINFNDDEQLGEQIRDDLAKLCNGRFQNKLGEDNLQKRIEAHKRPADCPVLIVPTIN